MHDSKPIKMHVSSWQRRIFIGIHKNISLNGMWVYFSYHFKMKIGNVVSIVNKVMQACKYAQMVELVLKRIFWYIKLPLFAVSDQGPQ